MRNSGSSRFARCMNNRSDCREGVCEVNPINSPAVTLEQSISKDGGRHPRLSNHERSLGLAIRVGWVGEGFEKADS